ncbi:MAG: hypothetical protein K0V04_18575 [Deltaproteobacteria bacterium]|nr:hypothetical protein [Deltaproteobacteria bacterium]
MVHVPRLALASILAGCGGPTITSVADDGETAGSAGMMLEDLGRTDDFPDWPPAYDGDHAVDVGDGTLADQLLVIGETSRGPVHLWMYAQRQGDTLTGEIAGAQFLGGQWQPTETPRPFTAVYLAGSRWFSFAVESIALSSHPYGDAPLVVDLHLLVGMYEDQLLCGDGEFDGRVGNDVQLRYVARPLAQVVDNPSPPLACP